MTETKHPKDLRAALQSAVVRTVEAEGWLEDAAVFAGAGSDKAEKIWDLKARLDRLGVEILELSKT